MSGGRQPPPAVTRIHKPPRTNIDPRLAEVIAESVWLHARLDALIALLAEHGPLTRAEVERRGQEIEAGIRADARAMSFPPPDPDVIAAGFAAMPTPRRADSVARTRWLERAVATAPDAPRWFLGSVAHMLAMAWLAPDALFWLADAIDEAARLCGVAGEAGLARQLSALAELPRGLAPFRDRKDD